MPQLSQETQNLIEKYRQSEKKNDSPEAVIHVDEIASRVASFYEKLRGIIDWKEEHLLKKSIIERVLRRRMLSKINIGNKDFVEENISAEPLILELIRTGHFPNDEISENKISQVQKIINKYLYIINNAPAEKSKIEIYQWLTSIAACEIEESLTPSKKQRALMGYMYHSLKERIIINESLKKEITEQEKNIQIYINVQRALFNLDSSTITYHIIKYQNSDWFNIDEKKLKETSQEIYGIKNSIEEMLEHPLSGKVYQICQKYNTPYIIIGEIIEKNFNQISQPQEFEKLIRENYNQKLKTLKSRLSRAAFYSTVSIFITNILALLILEIPLSKYFWEKPSSVYDIEIFNQVLPMSFLLVTIFVPTLLMAFLVLTIKPPGPGNLERVIMETMKIGYVNEKKDLHEIKQFRRRGPVFSFFVFLIYVLSFVVSLGIIVWALSKISYPPFSYLVFIVFLSLIAFAGNKIREKAKELEIVEEKEGFLNTLVDFFALPILYLGKWLSSKWRRYNVVSSFFNALIDMPFSIFIEFLEQWRFFLKEKKEKL
jgi:hypothetical protein